MRAQRELQGLTCFCGNDVDPMFVVRPDPEMGNRALKAQADTLKNEVEKNRQRPGATERGMKGFSRECMR